VHLHDDTPAVSPNVTAGVFLCARFLAEPLGLSMPSPQDIFEATGATRTRAYELAQESASKAGRPDVARVSQMRAYDLKQTS